VVEEEPTPREILNSYLASRDVSPIRTSMNTSWDKASERTKRHYARKAKQVVHTTLEELAPQQSAMLLNTLKTNDDDDDDADLVLLEALVECYKNASQWSGQRQILSIIADKVSFKTLQKYIPDITRYRFSIARHHLLLHGRGAEVTLETHRRVKVPLAKLDHFLEFITSSKVVQDLPFGEKTLKLSNNREIRVPNVLRRSIPEQIVKQYNSYCDETGFRPLSRSTLCRILSVCAASTRTSLQGLDYFSADGSKAFDDIIDVVDKLGDKYGCTLAWSKEQISKLQTAKRYLKGDYKVKLSSTLV